MDAAGRGGGRRHRVRRCLERRQAALEDDATIVFLSFSCRFFEGFATAAGAALAVEVSCSLERGVRARHGWSLSRQRGAGERERRGRR